MPDTDEAIAELGGDRGITATVPKPPTDGAPHVFPSGELNLPTYELGT